MTPKQQLCSAQYHTHIIIPVNINRQRTVAMVDSGATGNFISRNLVDINDLPTRKKKRSYKLRLADGSVFSTGKVEEETRSLPVTIQRHHEEITFDIIGMATYNVILGMPWLNKHNPEINWKTKVLKFGRSGDVTSIRPISQQRTIIDKRKNRRPVEAYITSSSKNKGDF